MATSATLPISIKGIVFENGRVWLRKNPIGEWELPGGRLDHGEQPETTVVRELKEELGFNTQVVDIVHSQVLDIHSSAGTSQVLIISYTCKIISQSGPKELIGEDGNAEFHAFLPSEIPLLNMPHVYIEAIDRALSKPPTAVPSLHNA